MTAEEFKAFSASVQSAPRPRPEAAAAAAEKLPADTPLLRQSVILPAASPIRKEAASTVENKAAKADLPVDPPAKQHLEEGPSGTPVPTPPAAEPEMEQVAIEMPPEQPWRLVGELFNSYIVVEQGEESYLIDKHAAHERILFEKLKANQERISSQLLLSPIPVRLPPAPVSELLSNRSMLEELGFEIEEFGDSTLLLRQIPMDLCPEVAAEALEQLAADLMTGRRERKDTVRDEILHTVACKAAIKAGWNNGEAELLALVKRVMADENLKHCPHGRPICITLSKKQLEKQFMRT